MANKTNIVVNKKSVTLKEGDFRRLFVASSQLADTMEDILESRGIYNKKFLIGLKNSLQQIQKGQGVVINSIAEI